MFVEYPISDGNPLNDPGVSQGEVRCTVSKLLIAPEFGRHQMYLERFPKSMYISHSLAVPKVAMCIVTRT